MSIDRQRPTGKQKTTHTPIEDKRSTEAASELDKAARSEATEVLQSHKDDAQVYEKRGPKKLILSNERQCLISLVGSCIEAAKKDPKGPLGSVRFWDPQLALNQGTAGILPPFKQFSAVWIRMLMGSNTKESKDARAALLECFRGDCFFPQYSAYYCMVELRKRQLELKTSTLCALGKHVNDLQLMSYLFGWQVLKQEAKNKSSKHMTTLRTLEDFDRFKLFQRTTNPNTERKHENDPSSEADQLQSESEQVDKRVPSKGYQDCEHLTSQEMVAFGIDYLKKKLDIDISSPPTLVARDGNCLWSSLELTCHPKFSTVADLNQRARNLRESSIGQAIEWIGRMESDNLQKVSYVSGEQRSREELLKEMSTYMKNSTYAGDMGDIIPYIGSSCLQRPVLIISLTSNTTEVMVNAHFVSPEGLFPSIEKEDNNVSVIVFDAKAIHYEPISVSDISAKRLKEVYGDFKIQETLTIGEVVINRSSHKAVTTGKDDLIASSFEEYCAQSKQHSDQPDAQSSNKDASQPISHNKGAGDREMVLSCDLSEEDNTEETTRTTRSVIGGISKSLINEFPAEILKDMEVTPSERLPPGYNASDDSTNEAAYHPPSHESSSDEGFLGYIPQPKKNKKIVCAKKKDNRPPSHDSSSDDGNLGFTPQKKKKK